MKQELLPIGVRRDGSYYTRIEWASICDPDPTFWVCNLIDDDTERCGGTWGANDEKKADVILSFFGEEQKIEKIRIFRNVGLDYSVLEELAKVIKIYVSSSDEVRKIKRKDDDINSVEWTLIHTEQMEKAEGWQEIILDAPVSAKYVRFELCENFCTDPFIPWIETSEIKMYPEK